MIENPRGRGTVQYGMGVCAPWPSHRSANGTYVTMARSIGLGGGARAPRPLPGPAYAERCRNARMRFFGHVNRRDREYVRRKTLERVPPWRRKRCRPKQRWVDCAKRDMRAVGTTQDEVHDRTGWRRIVSAAATHNQVGAARRRRRLDKYCDNLRLYG